MHALRRWLKPGQAYSPPADEVEEQRGNSHATPDNHEQHSMGKIPIAAYLLLPAAVFAISSSGTVFQLMSEVPPITLASWRLQLTAVVLAAGALWQWRKMSAELRQRALSSCGLLLVSGVCLAVHFGCWVWSLEHTSLTHSLLFVSCAPLLLAGWALLMRQPISRAEVLGSLLGLVGAVWLAFSAAASTHTQVQPHIPGPPASLYTSPPFSHPVRSSLGEETGQPTVRQQPQVSGDIASLMAAFAFVGYLQVGSKLRKFMPVFVYAFPVTATAALLLTAAAAITESSTEADMGLRGGVIGWMLNGRYAAFVTYLALVPGIVGHTGFNALLRYMTALTVALAFQLEPVGGSLIGWVAGVADAPGLQTALAGSLLLGATVIVTYASTLRQEQEARDASKGEVCMELSHVADAGTSETSSLLSLGKQAESAA